MNYLLQKTIEFKKINSRKINSNHWTGLYKCIGCSTKFYCFIKNLSNDVEIHVKYNNLHINDCQHLLKQTNCTGKERQDQAVKLLAFGNSNCVSENEIHNTIFSEILKSKNYLIYFMIIYLYC